MANTGILITPEIEKVSHDGGLTWAPTGKTRNYKEYNTEVCPVITPPTKTTLILFLNDPNNHNGTVTILKNGVVVKTNTPGGGDTGLEFSIGDRIVLTDARSNGIASPMIEYDLTGPATVISPDSSYFDIRVDALGGINLTITIGKTET